LLSNAGGKRKGRVSHDVFLLADDAEGDDIKAGKTEPVGGSRILGAKKIVGGRGKFVCLLRLVPGSLKMGRLWVI